MFLENASILKGKGTAGTLGMCLIEHLKFSVVAFGMDIFLVVNKKWIRISVQK